MHTALTITDVSAGAAKDWTFSSVANYTRGMVTRYDERASSNSTVLRRNDFTYTQDANGMPYTAAVTTTLDVGSGSQQQTKSEQTMDGWGNVTQSKAYAFNSLVTPVKTVNCSYTSVPASRIYTLVLTCSTVGGGAYAGQNYTMFSLGYDNYAAGGGLAGIVGGQATMQDWQNYGAGFTARGNVTTALQHGSVGSTMQYNSLGEVIKTVQAGTQTATSYTAATNWVAPSTITPNGAANLQSNMTWNAWFAPTGVSGPNGATVGTGAAGSGGSGAAGVEQPEQPGASGAACGASGAA